jgi:hypothetical protein
MSVARRLLGELAHPLASELRADKEPKYYLLQTPLRFVPMTAVQAARCNAALGLKSPKGLEPIRSGMLACSRQRRLST